MINYGVAQHDDITGQSDAHFIDLLNPPLLAISSTPKLLYFLSRKKLFDVPTTRRDKHEFRYP